MQPIFAEPDNVEIQGRVIAVIRQVGIASKGRKRSGQLII